MIGRRNPDIGGGCGWVAPRLSAFAGQDLPVAERAAVRLHLRDCAPCRTAAGGWLRAREALREGLQAPVPGIDDAFFARLHRDIVAQERDREPTAASRPLPGRWRRAVAGLAALLLVGAGVWIAQAADGHGLLDRDPVTASPVAGTTRPRPAQAPGARGPAMRALGAEDALWESLDGDPTAEWGDLDADSAGLMGRMKLRTLESAGWPRRKPMDRLTGR